MSRCYLAVLIGTTVCVATLAHAQPVLPLDPPLADWTAPPYWSPPANHQAHRTVGVASVQNVPVMAETTGPATNPIYPFTSLAPCRLVDTFHNASLDTPTYSSTESGPPYGGGDLAVGEWRTYDLAASTASCNDLPTGAGVVAWSLNFQYTTLHTGTTNPSYLTAQPNAGVNPTGTPSDSTILGYSDRWIAGAAVVQAGSDSDGKIDLYAQNGGSVIIEINGYYASTNLVNTLNTLTGDVTLSPGSNVDISPTGNTLTISMTGAPGGTLPSGTAGQTLRSNGSGWLANSFLYNDGSKVGIGTTSPNEQLELTGNLRLPTTGATAGQLLLGSHTFLHGYGSMNTFVGESSGNLSVSGYGNTGIGYMSLNADTSGYSNAALGRESLWKNLSGGGNTAMGMWALHSNTTADNNAGFGIESLRDNTTGHENTALGSYALLSNTVGINNTAVGHQSMVANTSAGRNTAVGVSALYSQSYANGGTAWDADNTAVGVEAMYSNQPTSAGGTSGNDNTALGSTSMYSNLGGFDNTALGSKSMYSNTTGWSNTAVGYNSLWNNKGGYSNTAIGVNALNGAATGSNYNTALGVDAGYNTTGSSNVLLGFGAGYAETGSNRLHIANSISKTLIWGDFSGGSVVINDVTPGVSPGLDVNGQIRARTWSGVGLASVCRDANGVLVPCTSDARLKTNIVPLAAEKDVLAVLAALRGVAFDWDCSNLRAANAGTNREIGLIAQEVEAVLPEVVHVEADGYRSMDYAKLTALLVEVAKAQQTEIEALKMALADRDGRQAGVDALTARVAALEACTAAK